MTKKIGMIIGTVLAGTLTLSADDVSPAFNNTGFDVNGKISVTNEVLFRGVSLTEDPDGDGNVGATAAVKADYTGKYGEGYVGVDVLTTSANPFAIYTIGYDNTWIFQSAALNLYTNVAYKYYDVQEDYWASNKENFETVLAQLGTTLPVGDGLTVLIGGEFTTNDPQSYEMKDRYTIDGSYTVKDTKIGAVKVGAGYGTQDAWGDDYYVEVGNQLKENLWLTVGYHNFDADEDFAGYKGIMKDKDYTVVNISYEF